MEIKNIIDAIQNNRIRISDHADEEAEADELTLEEIIFSVHNGEIIENYPNDRPFPSCLAFGTTFSGEPVHSVWAYNDKNQWVILITVYRLIRVDGLVGVRGGKHDEIYYMSDLWW